MKQQKIFFWACLNLLNISSSKFIDAIVQGKISYLVNAEKFVPVLMYSMHSLSVHPVKETPVSTFLLLCIMCTIPDPGISSMNCFHIFWEGTHIGWPACRTISYLHTFLKISLYFEDLVYI